VDTAAIRAALGEQGQPWIAAENALTQMPAPQISPGTAVDAIGVPEDLDEAEPALAQAPSGAAGAVAAAVAAAEPAMDPPGTPGAARTVTNAGAFAKLRVLSLFSSEHATNGWLFLEGVGWRRIATADPSAHVNLGLLGAAVRAQGTPTPVRHESDNQVHEIYLW
jgi:hypothetical protein